MLLKIYPFFFLLYRFFFYLCALMTKTQLYINEK